jgi:hypothetical protein
MEHSLEERYSAYEHPHPFSMDRTYSCFWKIAPELIKPDWKQAAVEHLGYWLGYFQLPTAKLHVGTVEAYVEEWSKLPVEDVQQQWQVPMWNGTNAQECRDHLSDRYRTKILTFIRDTLDRLS